MSLNINAAEIAMPERIADALKTPVRELFICEVDAENGIWYNGKAPGEPGGQRAGVNI